MNDSFPVPAIVSAGINARSEAMPLLLKCQYPCANLGRSSQILAKANKPVPSCTLLQAMNLDMMEGTRQPSPSLCRCNDIATGIGEDMSSAQSVLRMRLPKITLIDYSGDLNDDVSLSESLSWHVKTLANLPRSLILSNSDGKI
jgi:hypothetical protein